MTPFLPASVRELFWDTDIRSLRWDRHRDAIIGRVLAAGTWADITWLRRQIGDPAHRRSVDFDWFRHGFSLQQMLGWYREKFEVDDVAHLLYALVYFDDADAEPRPSMIWNVSWREVKETLRRWVKSIET